LHINGIERARDRLVKMLEALPPAEGKQVKATLTGGMDQLLKGRKLDAIPKDGRVFLAVNDISKLFRGDPAFVVLLPVTSYKEFKDTLLTKDELKTIEKDGSFETIKSNATGDEVTLHLVDLKGYVAITPSKDTAEVYAGKYQPAQSGAMGPDLSGSYL